jgi:hypothetical protein
LDGGRFLSRLYRARLNSPKQLKAFKVQSQ